MKEKAKTIACLLAIFTLYCWASNEDYKAEVAAHPSSVAIAQVQK